MENIYSRNLRSLIQKYIIINMFQLTQAEYDSLRSQFVTSMDKDGNLKSQFATSRNKDENLRSQIATSKDKDENLKSQFVTSSWGGRRKLPFAFTEHGVIMLSSVLN